MKSIIIYSTKYGATLKIAKLLEEKINGEVELYNIKSDIIPSLEEFDNVILGGSIYYGKIQKKLRKFISENTDALLNKRVGLFISGALEDVEQRKKELKSAFLPELYNEAKVKGVLGYELNFNKLNFLDKLITKSVMKVTETKSKFDENKINAFANVMSSK